MSQALLRAFALSIALPLASAAPRAEDPPARALLLDLTQEARLAGTKGSELAARNVARELEKAGWRAELEPRVVLLSYPRRIELSIFASGAREPLSTRIERFDPDAIPPGDVPMYNAGSPSGRVRARVVDVGRGLRADFERLKSAGVDVTGAIALCRYGGSYRGIKVDLAAQYGCAGILLFSDPKSDGAARGATWPAGPWKHAHEAQRGSISPMGRIPGDPSTPGWPSPKPGESAQRLEGAQLAAAMPKIPCLPIGAAEAERIRSALAKRPMPSKDGASADEFVGPGPIEVELAIDSPLEPRTIWNVIATLPGASDDYALFGNHRDAWVRGANDAASGTVALLRAAQRLGERAKSGWKPAHTLKMAFWDAEEFGLVGSTEWAEAHADDVRAHCIAYVNFDVGVSGTKFRGAGGSPGMLRPLRSALERVRCAEDASKSLWDDWRASVKDVDEMSIGLAGSGSDFAAFLHHLSRPVLDLGLSGSSGSGQYHTGFDDFAIVERFIDPGFVGHELCGKLVEELAVELATRGRASFDASEAALALASEATSAAKTCAEPLAGALRTLGAALTDASKHLASRADVDFYGALARDGGVPGRAWYRNVLWTPGLEDGYGSESFPTLRAAALEGPEALERELALLRATIESLRAPTKQGE